MKFETSKPIYIQILDIMFELVLNKVWKENERIPSIRDLATSLEVNPNTVARAYKEFEDRQIIQNQRGVGYFLKSGGYEKALNLKKEEFIKDQIPLIAKSLNILQIPISEFYITLKKTMGNSFQDEKYQ